MTTSKIIELVENQTISLPEDYISSEVAELCLTRFRNQLGLEPPWAKTSYLWRITSLGWVGFIPLSPQFGISLKPKAPLNSLFKMLTYAYKLKSIKFLEGEYEAESIKDFYDYLAKRLSLFVMSRTQKRSVS